MRKVKNRPVIRRISDRSLKLSFSRNVIAVLAIALTALMFTGLLTVSLSSIDYMQRQTMRQVGTIRHGGFKTLTQEQYDRLAADPEIKNLSYNIYIAGCDNRALQKHYTEIRWFEEESAASSFVWPSVGTIPEDYYDLACSTEVLRLLGITPEIGAKIPLTFTVNGKTFRDTFTLCGWWDYDPGLMADSIWVSREYQLSVCPTPLVLPAEQEDPGNLSGYLNPSFDFPSAWDLDGQMAALKERLGFDKTVNEGVNWAYSTASVDTGTIALIAGILLLIIFTGYLIIYNIFAISVSRDIRFYGLLKTVGTTGRQIRRLVRRQALLLSVVGIPIGLILGWIAGKFMVPLVLNSTSYSSYSTLSMKTSMHPAIFAGAVILAEFTIYISCLKPCRIASGVSPMEALRYNEAVSARKKRKKSAKVSPISMAAGNLGRSRGKTFFVILSITLSITLLSLIDTIAGGFRLDRFLEQYCITDFTLVDASLRLHNSGLNITDGVSPAVMEEIEALDGVTETAAVYQSFSQIFLKGDALKRAEAALEQVKQEMEARFYQGDEEKLKKDQSLTFPVYGIDDLILENTEILKGSVDPEKWNSGNYVILGVPLPYSEARDKADHAYYQPQESLTIVWGDGVEKDYEVLAIADLPYAVGPQSFDLLNADLLLPSQEFLKHSSPAGALSYSFNVETDKMADIQSQLNALTEDSDSLMYTCRDTYVKEFQSTLRMVTGVGGALTILIGIIGILNFINASITSIDTRKRELAMLQSIGMTGRQLKQMLIAESLIQIILVLVLYAVFGNLLIFVIMKLLSSQSAYFGYAFPLLPIAVVTPLLALMAILVPVILYRSLTKESLVERLRIAE